MTHARAQGGKHAAQRTCIVSGETRPRDELLRFVLAPGGQVVFDLKRTLPGRGAWLVPDRAVLEQAMARKAFARAFRTNAAVAPDLPEKVHEQISQAALSALSLARKAGQAVSGFDKVAAALDKGEVSVLISASDGAPDGRRKLAARMKKAGLGEKIADSFTSAQLSLAFSRPNVIHAAMTGGGLADRFLQLARWAKALGAGDGDAGSAARTLEQSKQ